MGLFSVTDILYKPKEPEAIPSSAAAVAVDTPFMFLDGQKLKELSDKIGTVTERESIFFKTDGAWSAIDLLEYLLAQTGPADIYFSTWSIGPTAITNFNVWQQTGQVRSVHAIIDAGFRNRKPDLYGQAIGTFPHLGFSKSHAKVTVIISDTHHVTMMGSANFTRNPRTETGIIICSRHLAEENKNWILQDIQELQQQKES